MTKREKQALKRLAAKPCAAEVFPREAPGCGNNESFCESCDAKDQLKDQQRIDDSREASCSDAAFRRWRPYKRVAMPMWILHP